MSGTVSGWRSEFGDEYAVPPEIEAIPGIVDVSWHNDACPSFAMASDTDCHLRIWVECPSAESREMQGPRFTVHDSRETEDGGDFEPDDRSGGTEYANTDNLAEAIEAFVRASFQRARK